jgi:hypothetical protein
VEAIFGLRVASLPVVQLGKSRRAGCFLRLVWTLQPLPAADCLCGMFSRAQQSSLVRIVER